MLNFKLILHSCVLPTLCCTQTSRAEGIPKMNSVSSSIYARVLYQETGNEDPPTATDPARTSATIRRQICADITSNGIFHNALLLAPVNPAGILSAGRTTNPDIFDLLFSDTGEYTNLFSEREFVIWAPLPHVAKEHVFACPVQSILKNAIFPYYVSKEYNVGSFHEPHVPGRFVFGSLQSLIWHSQIRSIYSHVMLAEQPAKAFKEPGFNIERHYIRLREYTKIGI